MSEDRRLHAFARIFWGLSHTFARAPLSSFRSLSDIGHLWAYTMRLFVFDACYQAGAKVTESACAFEKTTLILYVS